MMVYSSPGLYPWAREPGYQRNQGYQRIDMNFMEPWEPIYQGNQGYQRIDMNLTELYMGTMDTN